MQTVSPGVKKFFELYPHAPVAYETYNGSVYPTEDTALKSVHGHANKTITPHKNPATEKGKKKD